MSIRKIQFFFTATLCISILLTGSGQAQEARLSNINLSNTRDDLLIYLSLDGAFREKLKKAIHSGVPATFSFYLNLYQVRSMWMDKNLIDLKLTSTIKYDNLKKEYKVTRSWKKHNPTVTKSFEEAQKIMTEIKSHKIYPLSGLEKGKRYQLHTKAEVSKITLPFYLHYVLLFVALWDFETDWYIVDFIY